MKNEKKGSGCLGTILLLAAIFLVIYFFISSDTQSCTSGTPKPTLPHSSSSHPASEPSAEKASAEPTSSDTATAAQETPPSSDDWVLGDKRFTKNTAKHSYDALTNSRQRSMYEIFEASYDHISDDKFEDSYKTKALELSESVYSDSDPSCDYDLSVAYDAFYADYPQAFWLNGYLTHRDAGATNYTLCILSSYSPSVAERMKDEINSDIGHFYSTIPSDTDEYYLEKYVHDYLVDNCQYNETVKAAESKDAADKYKKDHPEVSTIYGTLHQGDVICNGYAQAFQLLCKCVGIDSVYIAGDSNSNAGDWTDNSAHAWNAALLSGDWYVVDVTWDDTEEPACRYNYLNVTDSQISNDHMPYTMKEENDSEESSHGNVFLPACTDLTYNYYVHDKDSIKISSIEDDQIGKAMVTSLEAGSDLITLYLDPDSIDFSEAKMLLFDNGNDNYMNRYLQYVSDHSKYSFTRYSYWPFESRHAIVMTLNN